MRTEPVIILLGMIKAFELIRARTGKEEELMKRLIRLPQVKETHLLAGNYDILATMVFENQPVDPREQMLPILTGKIRKMPLVRDTSTIVPALSLMRETHLENPVRRAYAFVFLSTKLGKEQEVMNEVFKFDEVAESHLLLGKSDVLAVLHFEKTIFPSVPEKATRIVTEKFAKIDNIVGTETLCPLKSITKS